MLQYVVVYKHEDLRLAHVGIYSKFFSDGTKNNGHTLNSLYRKARYVHECAERGEVQNAFSQSLMPWMINTNYSGWELEIIAEDIDLDSANVLKEEKATELAEEGYTININLKRLYDRNSGNGAGEWKGKIPTSPLGIKNFIDRVTLGIQFSSDTRKRVLMNDIDTLVNYPNGSLRVLNRNTKMTHKIDAWLACYKNR